MDSRDLTKEQCRWFHDELAGMARRLGEIEQRLEDREFPPDDKLRQLVRKARESVLTASWHAHTLACAGQMGVTYYFRDESGIGHEKPDSERPR